MSDTGYIGEHIAEVIDGLKREADDLMDRANAIDVAWGKWDITALLEFRAITESMADAWQKEREYVYGSERGASESGRTLYQRIAQALGWDESQVHGFSLQALRDLVRTVDAALADELSQSISSGAYIRGPSHRRKT